MSNLVFSFCASGQKPFVVERVDLPVELSYRPALFDGGAHVEVATDGIIYAYDQAIMRPAQFGTQCVPNWICKIQLAHGAKVSFREPLPEFGCQPLGQVFHQMLAVFCAVALRFDDLPADLPICGNHCVVDCRRRFRARGFECGANRLIDGFIRGRIVDLFQGQPPFEKAAVLYGKVRVAPNQ